MESKTCSLLCMWVVKTHHTDLLLTAEMQWQTSANHVEQNVFVLPL